MKILLLKNLDKDLVRKIFYLSKIILTLLLVLDQTRFNTSGISNVVYFSFSLFILPSKIWIELKNFLKINKLFILLPPDESKFNFKKLLLLFEIMICSFFSCN